MAWNKDGTRRPTTILEAALWRYAVQPVCRCGHSSTFAPHGLWWHFNKRGWVDRLPEAQVRFWCRVCGVRAKRKVRPVRIEAVKMSALDIVLPPPDEREWKRVVNRFRS